LDLLSHETSQNMLELLQVNSSKFERVPLSGALDCILAEDIIAKYNDSQFLTASRDGYVITYENEKIMINESVNFGSSFTTCNLVVEDGEYFANFEDKKVASSAIPTNMLDNAALMITEEKDKSLQAETFDNVIVISKTQEQIEL